ncbi:MAG: 2-C-methyl-D-erythritol 4-phosphate cytidylyltransferase [Defluviitaleaceae bacterium]|nr:2-C-methyl-D-erythritol 4-phosphate cytidylyltransferase [Defluviitaleaceae bacterium]
MTSVIIVAGGKGLRMGSEIPKQYIKINGKMILEHTIEKFQELDCVDEIIIVTPKNDILFCEEEIKFDKIKKFVAGGENRRDSVYNGLKYVSKNSGIVLVHDGVRPFVSNEIIRNVIGAVKEHGSAVTAVSLKDSIKFSKDGEFFEKSLDRSKLYLIQTPQGFKKDIITKAYENAINQGLDGTDDSCFVELLGIKPKIVLGSYRNIKITTKDDLEAFR